MLPGFWFSFALLALLRLTRGCTTLAATVSVLLSLLVVLLHFVHYRWIHPCCGPEPLDYWRWLCAAAWVTTLVGSRDREFALCGSVFLLLFLTSSAGVVGLLTGIALNLPLPRRKRTPPEATHGITRIRCHLLR